MTYYRNSGPALGILTILLLAYLSMLVHGTLSRDRGKIEEQRLDLVTQLGLSDLSLFTEARYTRHPSMADLHTAFQDHPISLDHFPSGSLIAPPSHLNSLRSSIKSTNDGVSGHAKLD